MLIKKIHNLISIFIGFFLKILYRNPKVKDIVIVGSSGGYGFNDNGKYLFLDGYRNKSEIYFVTRSYNIYKKLRTIYGTKILYNFSLRGISLIMRARTCFFVHSEADILFVHNKHTSVICLFHGMPIKTIGFDYKGAGVKSNKIMSILFRKFAVGHNVEDIKHIISNSTFFNNFLKSAWGNNNILVMSYPRVNYLQERMEQKLTEDSKMKYILYMPTHRAYGYGQSNPLVFYSNGELLDKFKYLNYEVKYRFHPNMKGELFYKNNKEILKKMFDFHVDAQDALLNTDILISDYSSCVFDFLVCEKPIVFYHYDNYEEADNDLYYPVENLNIGPVVKNESELEEIVLKIITDKAFRDCLITNVIKQKSLYTTISSKSKDYDVFLNTVL